jgi:hypothetical protein
MENEDPLRTTLSYVLCDQAPIYASGVIEQRAGLLASFDYQC